MLILHRTGPDRPQAGLSPPGAIFLRSVELQPDVRWLILDFSVRGGVLMRIECVGSLPSRLYERVHPDNTNTIIRTHRWPTA